MRKQTRFAVLVLQTSVYSSTHWYELFSSSDVIVNHYSTPCKGRRISRVKQSSMPLLHTSVACLRVSSVCTNYCLPWILRRYKPVAIFLLRLLPFGIPYSRLRSPGLPLSPSATKP